MKERDLDWFKFEPRSWLDDTRQLSLEERGAYIDAIALRMLHEGPLPDSPSWFAHQLHVSKRKAEAVMKRLVEALHLQREGEGITNAKCEKVLAQRAALRDANTRNIKKRWGITDQSSTPDDQSVNADPTVNDRSVNADPTVNAKRKSGEKSKNVNENNKSEVRPKFQNHTILELEVDRESEVERKKEQRSEDSPQPPKGGSVGLDELFEQWWAVYPNSVRKVAKGECRVLFRQAVTGKRNAAKKGEQKILLHGSVTGEQLVIAGRRYAATLKVAPEHIPAPATWLNQGRWQDESGKPIAPGGSLWWQNTEKVLAITPDQWRKGIAKFANGTWPIESLGPVPGTDGCVIPEEIVGEERLLERYDNAGFERPGWKP